MRFNYTVLAVLSLTTLTLCLLSGCGGGSSNTLSSAVSTPMVPTPQIAAFRSIAVPYYDGNYSTIKPQVIESQAELDRFLSLPTASAHLTQEGQFVMDSWREDAAFLQAIQEADIDFDKEALVLLPYSVHSGGIKVSLDAPQMNDNTFVSTIRVGLFTGGTAAFMHYCFAFAVSKADVKEVRVAVVDADVRVSASPINLRIGE